ncbi:unnamed protein product [Symbiodinium necroappetens]|uniref:Uncharacterized protein n=1 Tax=Symbiodinium necroappetens TaxID=1628268 RepID=A0A812SMJ4_9DINO|nr:unnamed protein product [Symbiodinium necroappetens]
MVLEFCRHSLYKGTWTHLLPPGHAWLREHDQLLPSEELPGEGHFEPNLLASLLATRLPYVERWRRKYHGPEHINCKEVRAYLQDESYAARSGERIRLLTGLDSQVALGALIKGRSSSGALNDMLEASLGPYLGCGLYPHFMYYLSELNPSDGPTRGRDPPLPLGPLPDWWSQLADGLTEPFDAWMLKVGAARPGFSFDHLDRDGGLGAASPEPLHAEVFRVRATPLAPEHDGGSCCLRLGGFSFPLRQFKFGGLAPDLGEPGYLDLFAGAGGVGSALVKLGAPWVLSFDLRWSPDQDLLDPAVQARIETLISSGCFRAIGMAPPCSSFSSAVTPAVRWLVAGTAGYVLDVAAAWLQAVSASFVYVDVAGGLLLLWDPLAQAD